MFLTFVQTQQQLLIGRVASLMQDEGPWPSPTAFVPAVISGMQEDSLALPAAHCGGAWREKRAHKSSQLSIVQF